MTEITVGLPVVDGMKEFELAVRSIFAQSYHAWRLVIVCDGSPENIINRALEIRDERVEVKIHSLNKGLATRLNEIANSATSEYVVRMDSDDVMHPERLSKIVKFLGENPDIDVLGSGSYLVNEKYEAEGIYSEPPLPKNLSGYLKSGVFSHPTVTYKTSWGITNPYDPSRIRTEDKELWLRTASTSNFAKLEDNLLFCMVPRKLSISKQALTARFDRKLLLELGTTVAPKSYVYLKVAQSLVKQCAVRISHGLGIIHLVHKTKFKRMSPNQLSAVQLELLDIAGTNVPGWD